MIFHRIPPFETKYALPLSKLKCHGGVRGQQTELEKQNDQTKVGTESEIGGTKQLGLAILKAG